MNRLLLSVYLLAVPVVCLSPQRVDFLASAQRQEVMLVAVSRDDSVLSGGKRTKQRTVDVEPFAQITKSGQWEELPCRADHTGMCAQFEREILRYAHMYTVISADGRGATVHALPITLSECYNYTGSATYSGAEIKKSAIAASSTEFFAPGPSLRLLAGREADDARKAVVASAPEKLHSAQSLVVFELTLEGREFVVVQTALADLNPSFANERSKLIFGIGRMNRGSVHVLHWKMNSENDEERVLGAIPLKAGRDFLVTAVNDPESQSFRVYGILHGRLALIYAGGGSSC